MNLGDTVRVVSVLRFDHQTGAFAIGGKDGFDQRSRAAWRLLLDAADPRAFRYGDGARIGSEIADDGPQQRGLAGAIAPDETGLGSGGQREARTFDQGTAGHPEREFGYLQHVFGYPAHGRLGINSAKARDA